MLGCFSGTSPDFQRDRNGDIFNMSNKKKDYFICNPINACRGRRRNCQIKANQAIGMHICKEKLKCFWVCRTSQNYFLSSHLFPKMMLILVSWPSLCSPWSWGWHLPHPQACHVRLGAKNHDGSLIRDKALRAGRHCAPCSPSLGSTSSGCLLTRRTGTPPGGKSCTELPLTLPQKHT